MTATTADAPRRHQPLLSPDGRVLVFSILLAVAGLTLFVARLAGDGAVEGVPFVVPWYWLALGLAITEMFDIHLEVRGEAHSLTFIEIPVVIGLVFGTPEALLIARLLGSFISLALIRRQAPRKLVFNLAMFAFETSLGITVFRAVLGSNEPVDPAGWVAVVAATVASFVVSTIAVAVVITLFSGWPGRQLLERVFGFGMVGCLMNTATGLAAASSLWRDVRSGVLLIGVGGAVPLVYRAYVRLNERYQNLSELHDFTGLVSGSIDLHEVATSVLDGTAELLRCQQAALLLAPVAGDDTARRIVREQGRSRSGEVHGAALANDIAQLIPDGVARIIDPHSPIPDWLTELDPKDIAAAPVSADGVLVGVIVVANRLHELSTFMLEDLRLLETVSNHASVALQKGRLVTQLQQEVAHRAHQALHDALTDLPNRVRLTELTTAEIDQAWRTGGRVGLLLVDLDTFKEVNDTLGHDTGDRLLIQVCERMQAFLPETAVLSRFGGDEFAVLLPQVTHADEAVAVAQRLSDSFEAPFVSDGVSLALGASIGVAVYPDHATDVSTLFQRTDAATYAARLDRAGFELYSPERDPYTPRRLALAAELREAIEAGQLEVYFQPKVQMGSGVVKGAEALVRWNHPRLGAISPAQFIPAAEHTGVIRPLTLYVVDRALDQCREWRQQGLDLSVAANLSARNLLDLHLVDDIAAIIEQKGLPASVLTLELTESTVMSESRRSVDVLDGLHGLGVRLSCDDFGTGYSSLAHLRRLPITEIKIDRSFVATMAVNESDRTIVRSILELGRSLGLRTVAEGVENADAWDLLREFGCDEAQGFYLARPLPGDQFNEWIAGRAVDRLEAGQRPVAVLEQFRRTESG